MSRPARVALVLAVALAPAARAHVLFERPTLRQWLAAADLAIVAEFDGGPRTWEAPDGSDRQDWFRVRVLEVLRGAAPGARLDFFPHAEGFPGFRAGERALVFLERTAARREFASLAPRFPWLSAQGAGQEWTLAGAEGDAILALARREAALVAAPPDASSRTAARELLLARLGSGVARLRSDAIAELVLLRLRPGFLDADTTAALARWADAPSLPPTQRLALARLLDGAPGFDAAARLRALAREPLDDRARAQVVRAAAASGDPDLRRWVATLARDDSSPALRREAAAALARTSLPR